MKLKTAFITHGPGGPIRMVRGWGGDVNCVEGLGLCLEADLFQGCELHKGELTPDYDVYLVNGNSTLWWLPGWLSERGHKAILLWEGSIDDYYRRDAESGRTLRRCIDRCSGILCHGPTHAEALRDLHPRTGWLGCPLPTCKRTGANPQGRWLNAPVAFHRGLPGALILASLQIPFVQYCHESERASYEEWLPVADVEYRSMIAHQKFREVLPTFKAVLNWDPIQTAGRFIADCSAMNVPCISTSEAAASGWLPQGWVVPPPPFGASELRRVLLDSGILKRCRMPVMEELTPARIRERFRLFVESLQGE